MNGSPPLPLSDYHRYFVRRRQWPCNRNARNDARHLGGGQGSTLSPPPLRVLFIHNRTLSIVPRRVGGVRPGCTLTLQIPIGFNIVFTFSPPPPRNTVRIGTIGWWWEWGMSVNYRTLKERRLEDRLHIVGLTATLGRSIRPNGFTISILQSVVFLE